MAMGEHQQLGSQVGCSFDALRDAMKWVNLDMATEGLEFLFKEFDVTRQSKEKPSRGSDVPNP